MPPEKNIKSLRLLLVGLIGITSLVFMAILFAIFRANMPHMLTHAEDAYLDKQIRVVGGLFADTQENTLAMAEDIAIWDETVMFARGENSDYIRRNWPSGTSLLGNYRFNFGFIKDKQGRILFEDTLDYARDGEIVLPEGFAEAMDVFSREVLEKSRVNAAGERSSEELGMVGVYFYKGVPYSFAIMPIMLELDAEETLGTVILGNVLTDEYFRDLTHYSGTKFELVQLDVARENAALQRESESLVTAELPLTGINGEPLLLRMSSVRTIYTEGRAILDWTAFLFVVTLLLFGVVLYLASSRFLLRPVERLSRDISRLDVFDRGLEAGRYSSTREFTSLCTAINEMTARLRQSQVSTDVLQRILNGIDAYLYVSDPQTDEILFINDSLLEHYQVKEHVLGKRCWEIMYPGSTGRCSYCPIHELERRPDAVITWEDFNEKTQRHYRDTDCFIDWSGGKKAHLHLRVDITDLKSAEGELTLRLKQQELMSAMAQTFLSTEDSQTLIRKALRMAGGFTGASNILLARYDEKSASTVDEYSWRNAESNTGKPLVPSLPFHEGVFLYDELIKRGRPVFVGNNLQAPENRHAEDGLDGLREVGVEHFIAFPVYASGELWGILTFDRTDADRPWTDSDIQLIALMGSVISGVLTRHATEGKLLRMSSIVDSSPQYISYINTEGRFEYLNQGVMDMSGYSEEELEEGGMALLFGQAAFERTQEDLIPSIMERGHGEFDLVLTRKNGEQRVLSFSAFTTGLKEHGIGSIAVDITEKLLLERELLAAKDQAEQSSRAKGEFLSRMSHEMRTPLNAIIGMTNIARSSDDPEKKEYCLEKIDSASSHLLGVINDILDMSKIEANKFELSYLEFNFEKMLMRVVNVVNFRIDEKNQNLIINVAPDVPQDIISDDQRLAQVIANLLSNAVKFTPEQGTITLSAEKIAEEDGLCTLKISVSDTGIGLTEEQAGRLFTSFEQADGGIARKYGGTGLGLAISRSIVEMMGGEIWVESQEGQGATFTFTVQARRGSSEKRSLLSPDVNWNNLRVLAVDDAPEVREYFLNFAQSINLSCEVAADGFEACNMLEQQRGAPFNIVFADWKMPGMNGIELTRRIKEHFGPQTVVIMISATEWSDIEGEAKSAGVDRFVPKPLFPSLLVNCINECMGAQQATQPEQAAGKGFEDGCFDGHRILLAEDIEINREIVHSLLEHTGISIDSAENGAQAVEMFENNPDAYDLILMDIHMPEVDGYEATRRIRALDMDKARNIPIVAMTANVFREDVERCLAAGMNDHIGKPINLQELLERLRDNLH